MQIKDIKSDLNEKNEQLKKANDDLQAQLRNTTGDVVRVTRDPAIGFDLKELLQGHPLCGENSQIRLFDPKLFEDLDT